MAKYPPASLRLELLCVICQAFAESTHSLLPAQLFSKTGLPLLSKATPYLTQVLFLETLCLRLILLCTAAGVLALRGSWRFFSAVKLKVLQAHVAHALDGFFLGGGRAATKSCSAWSQACARSRSSEVIVEFAECVVRDTDTLPTTVSYTSYR